jgi:hypothetical protein
MVTSFKTYGSQKGFEDPKQFVLHAVLLALGLPRVGACMCANGHAACWCKEHPAENILLAVFFVKLGKWVTRPLYRVSPIASYARRM